MSVQLTITIQTSSDIGNTQLINNTKAYAKAVLKWTEQIPDPDFVQSEDPEEQVEVPLIDNPTSFLQAVYGDNPTNKVKQWIAEREGELAKADAVSSTQEALSGVEITVETE